MPLNPRQFDLEALRTNASATLLQNDQYYGDSTRFPGVAKLIDQEYNEIKSGGQDYELMHEAHSSAFDPETGQVDKSYDPRYGYGRPVYRQD